MIVDIGLLAQWIGALGMIGGVAVGIVKFFRKLTHMDEKLDTIMSEQRLLAKGNIAALNGLIQLKCNGEVTKALSDLEEHYFEQAHK